uniref:Uncharacterized protein n=1 Tax=Arundo donax TaxID=35708 RepID=A0A0A8YKM7_ARUDO
MPRTGSCTAFMSTMSSSAPPPTVCRGTTLATCRWGMKFRGGTGSHGSRKRRP